MKMDLYRKIIDEAKDYISLVILCISGESLLHPQFPQMIRYAKQRRIVTYLSTNCTVLTPKLSEKILSSGLDWINFSFDGCSKEIYEKVRVGGNFKKSLQNVIDFLKIKEKLGAKTHAELQILIMDEKGEIDYQKNIDGFQEKFKGLPLGYIQKRKPSTWGRFFEKTNKFNSRPLGKSFSPCSYLWCSMSILQDGRVVACCSDFFGENVLGKFPDKPLKEIWNDKPMRLFRKAMIKREYLKKNKNCLSCDALWEPRILGLPSGLRGISAAVAGSVFGANFFGFFKKISKLINPSFAIEVLKKK